MRPRVSQFSNVHFAIQKLQLSETFLGRDADMRFEAHVLHFGGLFMSQWRFELLETQV